jgi:hypothetical protein
MVLDGFGARGSLGKFRILIKMITTSLQYALLPAVVADLKNVNIRSWAHARVDCK